MQIHTSIVDERVTCGVPTCALMVVRGEPPQNLSIPSIDIDTYHRSISAHGCIPTVVSIPRGWGTQFLTVTGLCNDGGAYAALWHEAHVAVAGRRESAAQGP